MSRIREWALAAADVAAAPFTLFSTLLLKAIRAARVERMRVSLAIFRKVGLFPIQDHYYEPLFNPKHLKSSLADERSLPGLEMNAVKQLAFLSQFTFQDELTRIPKRRMGECQYYYDNPNFGPGDSEYLYSIVRLLKPRNVMEIGSGYSTLMIREAITRNNADDESYACKHVCIEPYEMSWLERVPGIEVLRERAEDVSLSAFRALRANDILFIDSSHVVRPQGDVLYNFFQILPALPPGVFVHFHDIFTPYDYPESWVVDKVRLWTEQYLLEAFLSYNTRFEIIGALGFLVHHYPDQVKAKFPVMAEIKKFDVGSFWIRSL